MRTYGKDTLKRGDACEVMDLRTGEHWTGIVVKEKSNVDPQAVVVKRDSDGVLVRVGMGFVRLLP